MPTPPECEWLSRPTYLDSAPSQGWPRTRVLIANHQPIVRHGIRALLATEPDIEIIGEAENGSDAVELARRFRPDVVVIDLMMPDVDGIAATRMIRATSPTPRWW